MRIALGSDHGGFELKQSLGSFLTKAGNQVDDVGPRNTDAVDYPDYAERVARKVVAGEADFGIMIDGAGIGSAMTANKIPGIRAAVCNDLYSARNSRAHNNANVLTMGSRIIGGGVAEEIVTIFLATAFEGGRHAARVDKITALEQRYQASTSAHSPEPSSTIDSATIKAIVAAIYQELKGQPGLPVQSLGTASPRQVFNQKVVTEELARSVCAEGGIDVDVDSKSIITPLAADYFRQKKIRVHRTKS